MILLSFDKTDSWLLISNHSLWITNGQAQRVLQHIHDSSTGVALANVIMNACYTFTALQHETIITLVFPAFFTFEIILKSIAYGFILGHRKCYLRSILNLVDAFVVIISILNITLRYMESKSEFSIIRVLRVIRVVRMLRLSSQLKHVINCLVNSVQKIVYFLVLNILILLIYSIIGKFMC